jgi:UDP-N-acetylmuramoylalanine--D-glutamate ligase
MDEYAEAKFRIFANQAFGDYFIGNLDDERVASLDVTKSERNIRSRQLWFTLSERHQNATIYVQGDFIVYAPISGDPRPVRVMRKDEIPLAGKHNVQNVMAALLAAYAVGCETAALREAVMSFRAMPHRLETVDEIDGVLYIDDSKSTNPGSVVAALHAYARPIVLIAGGRPKGTDFIEMGVAIRQRAKGLVLIGEAADAIAAHTKGIETERAGSMFEAVQKARELATSGDVVLLSPGCASFDMFRSAEERGEQFTAAVHALREPAGA